VHPQVRVRNVYSFRFPVSSEPFRKSTVIPRRSIGADAETHQYKPGELLGSVSGELGLRKFLERLGHTFVVTSDKEGPTSVVSVLGTPGPDGAPLPNRQGIE
jgi:hypothetical protein